MNKWEALWQTPYWQERLRTPDVDDAAPESPEDRMAREQAEREDEAYENHVNKELGVQ